MEYTSAYFLNWNKTSCSANVVLSNQLVLYTHFSHLLQKGNLIHCQRYNGPKALSSLRQSTKSKSRPNFILVLFGKDNKYA